MAILKTIDKPKYTYQDYLQWPETERWEIIDGAIYAMSPSPGLLHQLISGRVFGFLFSALERKSCIPFHAPFDVVFSESDIVQPDLFVVCDSQKMTDACILGAPDMIIEILSPSSMTKDHSTKKDLYQKYGVKEYVIIDPLWERVYRYTLSESNQYGESEIYQIPQNIPFATLPGISLPLEKVFNTNKESNNQ